MAKRTLSKGARFERLFKVWEYLRKNTDSCHPTSQAKLREDEEIKEYIGGKQAFNRLIKDMANAMNVPVLGLVENYSYLKCPDCGKEISVDDITENDIENLISAQTDSKCLVTYSDDSIEVILPKDVLDDNSVVKIKDIIISKTKLTADKITIIETK